MKLKNVLMSPSFGTYLQNQQTIVDAEGIEYLVEDIEILPEGVKCSLTLQNKIQKELIDLLNKFNTPMKSLDGEALEILNKTFKRHFKQTPTRL